MQHGQTSWTNLFSTYSRISTAALPAAASRESYRSSLPEDDEYSNQAKARSELEGELGGRRVTRDMTIIEIRSSLELAHLGNNQQLEFTRTRTTISPHLSSNYTLHYEQLDIH